MSYARKGPESDVYVYRGGNNDLLCCHQCVLNDDESREDLSAHEMIEHLQEHEEVGHRVPSDATDRLWAEVKSDERETVYLYALIELQEVTIEHEDESIEKDHVPVLAVIRPIGELSPSQISVTGVWSRITEADGPTYADAMKNLRSLVERSYAWLEPYVEWGDD